MSQHTEHPVFDGFLTLWVFNPKRSTEITHSDLLVYSALAQAHRRHQILTNVDLSWRTGLDRGTIADAIKTLEAKKMIEDRTPLERTDLFWKAKNYNAEHWSQRLRFWKCLVRCQGSKLRVTDQSVLSYVWWSKVTGFDPPKGWSARYVASIIKIKPETVEKAIARLEQMCLLKRDGQKWLVPKFLSPLQEEWFVRKTATHTEKIVLGEFEPDIRQLASTYIPGEPVVCDQDDLGTPDTPWPGLVATEDCPVNWIAVRSFCGELLASHGLTNDASAVIRSVKSEIERLGTTTDDWKGVITEAVAKQLAKPKVPPRPARSKTETDEENFRREFESLRA